MNDLFINSNNSLIKTQSRAKGTLDNYLKNRFKLDGDLYCRSEKVN